MPGCTVAGRARSPSCMPRPRRRLRPPSRTAPARRTPALHLLIAYPRNAGRLTGEQVRLELLRRIQARTGEAA